MIFILLALLQAPPPFTGPPPEPPPPPLTSPCQSNPGAECTIINMIIAGEIRMFTQADVGRPLDTLNEVTVCYGRVTRGSFRYYATGTAPSSLVGILVPAPIDPVADEVPDGIGDPENTLEEGNVINLYSRELVLKFKATQANWDGADLTWECQL